MNTKKIVKFSALGFIISNIGAAVGIGNIWRFPSAMFKNGGSAFVLAYFIVLILIVLPIVLLEMNYGLFFKRGVVPIFHRTGGVFGIFFGWKQTLLNATLCVYYLVIMAWIGISFVISVIPNLFQKLISDQEWFNRDILKYKANADLNSFGELDFSPFVLISALVLLFFIFLIIKAGLKNGLEKANYIFVPGLLIIIFALTIYATFGLKDGLSGVNAIFNFNGDKLKNPIVWYEATKQAIFSTSIMYGVMIVFAKNADIRMDKGNEAILIILVDSLVGILSGLLIASLVAHDVGKNITTDGVSVLERNEAVVGKIESQFSADNNNLQGGGLLFNTLPRFFGEINTEFKMWTKNFGFGNFLMIIFCINLLFAALSSIIGLLESVTETFMENLKISRNRAFGLWASVAILMLIIYSSSWGSKLVDSQDSLVLYFILFIGVLEVIFFTYSKYYPAVIKQHDQHSYLKMKKPWNWHKILISLITLPILLSLLVIGFFETFWFVIDKSLLEIPFIYKFKDATWWKTLNNKQSLFSKDNKVNWIIVISFVTFGFLWIFALILSVKTYFLQKKNQNKVMFSKKLKTL